MVGCSNKVNENIDESMAKDTEKIISIIDDAIKEDRDLNEKEEKYFEQYELSYGAKYKSEHLTEEEERLYLSTQGILENPEFYYTLESDKEKFESTKETLHNIIKTGNIYGNEE